jgi:hypothetical protein
VARVLAAGAVHPSDPGDVACVRAIDRALPGWEVVRGPANGGFRHWFGAAQAADAIVVAGATLFDRPRRDGSRMPSSGTASLAMYARVRNKPLAMVGLGAGSPSTAKERSVAREIVRSSDLLVLRDADSASALSGAGAPPPFRIGSEASWTAFDSPLNASSSSNAILLVISANGDADTQVRFLHEATAPLEAEGRPLHLQPWTESDVTVARALTARLGFRARVFEPVADLVAFRALCSGHRVVVAGNVHALVAAGAAGVPFIAVGEEPGAMGLAKRLAQSCFDPKASTETLSAIVKGAAARSGPPESAVEAEIAGAHETLRLLRVFLSGGRTGDADSVSGLTLEPVPWR